jgi:GntR family transcriptional regulator
VIGSIVMQEVIQLFPEWAKLAAHIRAQIRSGELAPGAKLPSAAQLKVEHDVSDPVIRYAMHALHTEGLVESAEDSGVFVADHS